MRYCLITLFVCLLFSSASSVAQTTSFDIRSYGAQCNGTANDYTAIQLAINAAGAAGGGIVTGPSSGTCITDPSKSLNLLPNVSVRGFSISAPSGQPMAASMFVSNNGSSVCSTTLISGVRIENMKLDGQATAETDTNAPSALTLVCVTNSRVEGNQIQNIGWEGVNFVYSTNSILKSNTFFKIYGDCADAQGLGSDGIVMDGNICDAGGAAVDGGFSANINSANTVITNNVVKGLAGSAFGIEVAGGHGAMIANNIIESGYSASGNGIRAYNNVSTDSYDITISNNIIGAPPSGGFCINLINPNSIHQTNAIKITGNQCIGSSSSNGGFYINGYSVELVSNSIRIPNSSGICILLDANANVPAGNLSVHDNFLIGCGTAVYGGTNGAFSNLYLGPEFYVP